MTHLLDRDPQDGAPPARGGIRFHFAETVLGAAPEAERRIEVRAHEVVFQLGGLVELVDQCFARNRGYAGLRVHGSSARRGERGSKVWRIAAEFIPRGAKN
jgi:hypothetical protein